MIIAAFGVVLLAAGALALLARFLLTRAGRRAGESITRTHQALEQIVEGRRVPAAWLAELDRKMPGVIGGTPRQQQAARRYLLGRLAGLRRYCARSTMIDGPETLAILLDGLGKAEREWRELELERIVRGPDGRAGEG